MRRRKPIIMVSSAVFGIEDLLNQVYTVLSRYGFEVWMSYKGTIPTDPKRSNFENCLQAVNDCDLFLGIICGRYGSGVNANGLSITHLELQAAIQVNKPRWFLVHTDVVVARQLLRQFRFDADGKPKQLDFKRTSVLENIRILDMYEQAIRHDVPLASRTGNWVQPYIHHADVLEFLRAQFRERHRIVELLQDIREGPKP